MPPVHVNPAKVPARSTPPTASTTGLAVHHHTADELWVKIHKVGSGLKSITPEEAIDVVLCWGWIDGIRKALDHESFLQRYTPESGAGSTSTTSLG